MSSHGLRRTAKGLWRGPMDFLKSCQGHHEPRKGNPHPLDGLTPHRWGSWFKSRSSPNLQVVAPNHENVVRLVDPFMPCGWGLVSEAWTLTKMTYSYQNQYLLVHSLVPSMPRGWGSWTGSVKLPSSQQVCGVLSEFYFNY